MLIQCSKSSFDWLLTALCMSFAVSHDTSERVTGWQRRHVIERIYGAENAQIRREISRIENSMERYQTGLPSDFAHYVPYDNHPYDEDARRLQENGTIININYQPMRIKFFTFALDDIRNETNSDKIDWYVNNIIPAAGQFWTKALSVVPVSGNLRISAGELSNRMYCGDSALSEVPSEHISTGVSDVDLILYVSGSDDPTFCAPQTLAVAIPCNFDQFDRPTAGAINVCLQNIQLSSNEASMADLTASYEDVTIHETGHVLGLSSNSYRFYWNPTTGLPRTPRPFEETEVTCVTGVTQSIVMPSNETLILMDDPVGRRYAVIVTEKVQSVARNQFNCQSMLGGQLENQPTRADSCLGDHWDERLYFPELMTSVISSTSNVLSAMTLALLEDTGWYVANYTQSAMSGWGLGAGCDFVNEVCLSLTSSGTVVPDYSKGYFCGVQNEKSCSYEFTHKLACTIIDYDYFVPQTLPDEQYQYFASSSSLGGPVTTNYCPVYQTPYDSKTIEELDCTNPDNTGTLSGGSFNVYSEVYGSSSRCIPTTLGEGLCFQTACVQDPYGFSINVRGEWHTCEYDFQTIDIVVGQGLLPVTILCPRITQMCPDLVCPFLCAGRGICNYDHTANGTTQPQCECFDTNDTSPGCSNSMIPNGEFLTDPSGLKNNIEQNFFDPLVAVFVDDPDSWTPESWAWAAGIIGIFVTLLGCICSSFLPHNGRKRLKY